MANGIGVTGKQIEDSIFKVEMLVHSVKRLDMHYKNWINDDQDFKESKEWIEFEKENIRRLSKEIHETLDL